MYTAVKPSDACPGLSRDVNSQRLLMHTDRRTTITNTKSPVPQRPQPRDTGERCLDRAVTDAAPTFVTLQPVEHGTAGALWLEDVD